MDTAASHHAFAVDPDLLLQGDTPRLIDEWQAEPELWNHVRHAVDDRRSKGQFILTGSAVPRDDPTRHSGAGRFIHLRMRPMTLTETGHSTGTVSLAEVLAGGDVSATDPGLTVADIAERIVIGGWPAHLGLSAARAMRAMSGYIDDVCRVDVHRLDGVRRDPAGVRRLISSARPQHRHASQRRVADGRREWRRWLLPVGDDRLLPPGARAPHGDRGPGRVEAADAESCSSAGGWVRHLADPSLATAALNADPTRVLGEIEWMGFLFEFPRHP